MDNNLINMNNDIIDDAPKVLSGGTEEDYLFADIKKGSLLEDEAANQLNYFTCRNCKTTFVTKMSTNTCVFCNSNDVMKISGQTNNLYYIPFSKTVDDAINDYKKKIRFRFLLPSVFTSKESIKSIKKVYLPFLLRDCNTNGKVIFYAADQNKVNKQIETKKYEVCYDVNFDFKNLSVSRFSKIENNAVLSYEYNSLTLFDNNVFNDSCGIIDDLDENAVINNMNNQINNSVISMVRDGITHQLKKLKNNGVVLNNVIDKRALLPVFLNVINYKNTDYIYIMNGQTGESNLMYKISPIKLVIVSIITILIIFFIVFLVASII